MTKSPHPNPLPAGEGVENPVLAAKLLEDSRPSRGRVGVGAASDWPLWEIFIRSKQGLEHKHCGSLHAVDARQALQMARDVYTRRQEGVSIWVVPSNSITASSPDEKAEFFEPMADKIYRHPTFYEIPDEVGHM